MATFGGHASTPATVTVTPTSSKTVSQVVFSPVGFLSVFAFKTPIPYPFGAERTGYLVRDIDAAVAAARAVGAEVRSRPSSTPLDATRSSAGRVVSTCSSIGIPRRRTTPPWPARRKTGSTPRRPRRRVYRSLHAVLGRPCGLRRVAAGTRRRDRQLVTTTAHPASFLASVRWWPGHRWPSPWPYGREITGYETPDWPATLAKAKAAGASVLAGPYEADGRTAAMLQFPGGYIVEAHAPKTT